MAVKYEAVFVRQVGNLPRVVGTKKFDPSRSTDGVTFKKKTYLVDFEKPVFAWKNGTLFFIFDMDTGQQTGNKDIEGGIDPNFIQAVITKRTAQQLVAGLQTAGNWMLALVIGIMGGVLGLFGGIVLQAATHLIGG